MIPEGSRLDLAAERLEQMRRHESMQTYRLSTFFKDMQQQDLGRHLVTAGNLPLHLRALRLGESKALGTVISDQRVREMIHEIPLSKEELAMVDPGVVEQLGLTAA